MSSQNASKHAGVFAGVVGEDRVSTDPLLLEGYAGAGEAGREVPGLIVRPSDARQVAEVFGIARESGANLVLSSSGSPHQRGDTTPYGPAVIVDLSSMDRIVRVDRRNKVALIEPGVRFGSLIEAADGAGLKVLMPLLPRADKSVLASYLEREPITIPRYHWDMTDPLLCTELVFGTGDIFRTGSAAGPGSLEQQWATGGAQKNPMGPAQTDFAKVVQGSQGTMAAVTWATVKLEVKPSLHRLYFIPDDRLSRLIDFSYRALRPKLADEFFIMNARSLATVISDDPERIDEIAGRQAPYTLVYGVSGFDYFPEMRVSYQENDIARIAQAVGVKAARDVPGASAGTVEARIAGPSSSHGYKSAPRGAFLDIFFLTTLERCASFTSAVMETASGHGYSPAELGVYVQPIQHGRLCHLEFTIYYDPADEADAARARGVFVDASDTVSEMGAFFSRPYGIWADLAYAKCPDTVNVLKKVKKMLDPAGVLNRGKLCFEEV